MKKPQYREELDRARRAAGLGLVATAAMTVLILLEILVGPSSLFRPFPVAFIHHLWPSLGVISLALATVLLHFTYGAAAAVLFSFLARPMSVGRGLLYGLGLWMIMETAFVPLGYGWLEFGLGGGHPWPAISALVLHLVYGGTLGWLGAQDDIRHHSRFDGADRLVVA